MVFDQLKIERDIRFEIDAEAVYALLGYKEGQTKLPQRMLDLIDFSFQEAQDLLTPVAAYRTRKIKSKDTHILFQTSGIWIKGESARNLLKNSFAVIFMAVTIGTGLEERIQRYTEEKQFEKTLILDAIGSEAADASANAVNHYLTVQARQEKIKLTRRFSPGYGDLPLSFQADLFQELSLQDVGISIDRTFVLFPRKTVTAIFGVEE
jgi:hypothetical protein